MSAVIVMILLGGMGISAVILGFVVMHIFKSMDDIELVQGRLENSDSSIADAMPYLKITNEWSR